VDGLLCDHGGLPDVFTIPPTRLSADARWQAPHSEHWPVILPNLWKCLGDLNRYRPEFELMPWDGASWNQAQPFSVGQTEYAKVTPVKGEHHVNPFTVCQVY
jgi:hypothetical protein